MSENNCKPSGVVVKPDGVHELSLHDFVLDQIHTNVNIWCAECETCGTDHLTLQITEDTVSEYYGEKKTILNDKIRGKKAHFAKGLTFIRNVTAEILVCRKCGEVSIGWKRQPDTLFFEMPKLTTIYIGEEYDGNLR